MKRKIFVVAAVIFSSRLPAQDTIVVRQLDEAIVTANKMEQKQSSTGKVVSVITRQQMERSAGKSVAQVLNEEAGVVVNGANSSPGSVQTVFLRGGGAGRTLILIDGIPLNDPSTIEGDFNLNLLSVFDVERIEICKGAQSTLYGSDAVAGVINIITIKKEKGKPINGSLTVAGGTLNTFKANARVYGTKGKMDYDAGYSRYVTDGFSSAYDSTGKQSFDKDGLRANNAHASLVLNATKDFHLKAFVRYSEYVTDIDALAFTDEKDFTAENKLLTAGTGMKFAVGNVVLTGNYQYTEQKRNYLNDSTFVGGFAKFERNNYFSKNQYAELYASIRLAKNFTLLQGGDYRYGSMNNDYLSISAFGPFTSSFRDTSVSQASLYASLVYNDNNEKLNVEVGGRLNVHSRYGSNYTYTVNPSYRIDEHHRIFGSIASGFKAPSLYQLYASGGTGNSNLLPEKSTSYEVGIQQNYRGIHHRLVFFYREIKDGIDFNYIDFTYFNLAEQIVRGLEYETVIEPVKNLTVTGNYTYLSGYEKTESRVDFKDSSYHYLLRRPKHNINVRVAYQFTPALLVSVGGKYVSSRYDVGGYQQPDVLLNDYFLLNAYAEFRWKQRVRVFADVQNLTDKKFFETSGYNAIPFIFAGGITLKL